MKYTIFNLLKSRPVIVACFISAVLLWPGVAFSQKYSFTNYSIEDRLLQSQGSRILQDKILTDIFGATTIDHSGKIWSSNASGLYYFYADHTIRFTGDNHDSLIVATQLVADKQDNIWGLSKQRLFKITGSHVEHINVTGAKDTI